MFTTFHHKDEMAMAWLNLSFMSTGFFTNKNKPILVKLSGQINFHTLTALMGPSGAGKTTLLKCINMRNKEGITSDSKVFVNKYTPLRTCFIMQDSGEHLLMGLTVRESLLFASKIKNLSSTPLQYRDSYAQTGSSLLCLDGPPENVSEVGTYEVEPINNSGKFDHNRNVDKILAELLLEDCASNSVDRCSGGEQKRLSVGLELMAQLKPNLLCIDEPTSGLDSNAAELVVQCLSLLAQRHQMAIVTSIHQPNSLLLNMFDQLYVLSKGGHCVFKGRPNLLRQHLSNCGINCAEDVLPIELLLKISSKFPKNKTHLYCDNNNSNDKKETALKLENDQDSDGALVQEKNEIDRLIEITYENSGQILKECKNNGKSVSKRVNKQRLYFNFRHFYYLLLRGFSCYIRYQWRVSAALGAFAIIVSGFLIYLYGTDIGKDGGCLNISPTDLLSANQSFEATLKNLSQDSMIMLNLKCQFFVIAFLQFVSMSCNILTFPQEVKIFMSEHHNKWYSTSSFFWSKCILEIPPTILISYIYSFIMYYGTGQLNDTFRFAYFTLITMCGMLISNSFGSLIGIIFANNFQVAVSSGVACYLVLVLLCGFFVPLGIQHVVVRGASYFSQVKLTFESIMITLYGMDRCEEPEVPILLHQLNLDDDLLANHAWFLLGHCILWRLVAMTALSFRANDFNLFSIFKRRPQLKENEDNKSFNLVSDYCQD